MREPHYFEDFAAGQVFRSGPYRMERDAIIAFAREFDPQPQHLGEAEAARSQFGQLVASGWHTAAVSMRLFIQDALPPIAGGGQGLGLENLVWVRPVRPGDELHVVVEVLSMRPSRSRPDRGIMKARITTKNQAEEVVQSTITSALVPCRVAG
ncbi:MaoC family dehydratase [Roseomonas gilardii]|uniref:MaoC family dehydratase n=1 Tax=Roseomonas gilardii TaxID=257708 RepID=UPI0004868309|nr:MaoC family dehydratase [Roseomonas gilardii]SUE42703.1 bifunctional aldehyde dehydrogenase/enoyl-CoA hydratase [Roseomonas gilardii subsp. rosea]